jgi:type II secretion system protein I
MISKNQHGFALVEILIAVTILSLILLSVLSSVSSSIYALGSGRYYTRAMLIAKSKLNEFILLNMRGMDISNEQVREYEGYKYSRTTTKFDHPMLGPIPANITKISVVWKWHGKTKKYTISYIFQDQ